MCLGCREKQPQRELIRIRYGRQTKVWHVNRQADGRSAYWCGKPACLVHVLKQGRLARALQAPISEEDISNLRRELEGLQR